MSTQISKPATSKFLEMVAETQRNSATNGRTMTRAQASVVVARRNPDLHRKMQSENVADPQVRAALLAGAKSIHQDVQKAVREAKTAAPVATQSPAGVAPIASAVAVVSNPGTQRVDPLSILCDSDQSVIMRRLGLA